MDKEIKTSKVKSNQEKKTTDKEIKNITVHVKPLGLGAKGQK